MTSTTPSAAAMAAIQDETNSTIDSTQPSLQIHWNWLALWALLAAFATFEVVKHGFVNGTMADAALLSAVAVGCFIAPDLTFLIGVGQPVEHGHLASRAVPCYNVMHCMSIPFALTTIIGIGLSPLAFGPLAMFIGGLSWMAHIALDRAAGYGLRNPDGSRERAVTDPIALHRADRAAVATSEASRSVGKIRVS